MTSYHKYAIVLCLCLLKSINTIVMKTYQKIIASIWLVVSMAFSTVAFLSTKQVAKIKNYSAEEITKIKQADYELGKKCYEDKGQVLLNNDGTFYMCNYAVSYTHLTLPTILRV